MCRRIDLGSWDSYLDAMLLSSKASGLHRKNLRSREWKREPNNKATSKTGSRFHSRRRKCQPSSKCVRTIQPTRFKPREAANRIIDHPHQAANSVRIARAAFPSTQDSPSTCKHSNNSSIANKEHVDHRPIPDNDPIHRCRGKCGHHFENRWPRLRWNRLLSGSSV